MARCERCQSRAHWVVRGRRKRFDQWGELVPAAPWAEWHELCSDCLEPVKAELELAELLELQIEPIDPHHQRLSTIVLPRGVGGLG